MYDSLFKPIESVAVDLFETAAELLDTGSGQLARSNKGVVLPRDLYAHRDVQTEWWYYTGHCRTQSGREFGFELVFFKRRTDHDRIGILPARLIANPMYAAHFAVSDITNGIFSYEHRRSFNKPFDIPVRMAEDEYSLSLGDWNVREDNGSHILEAGLKDGTRFTAVLEAAKEPILNGDGDGLTSKGDGTTANHFSFTRMALAGRLTKDRTTENFTGCAWMDKEFGTWDQKFWDWFSLQFDDGTELMIYHFRDLDERTEEHTHAILIDEEGRTEKLGASDFELRSETEWTSPKTGTTYPSTWTIRVPSADIDVRLTPLIEDQELDTRGTTMVVYWEGCCSITGAKGGRPVSGKAYAELVGYDKTHNLRIDSFFFGSKLDWVKQFTSGIFSET